MALGTEAFKLVVDAKGFVEGTTLSRNEMKLVRKAIVDTATDAQKLTAAEDLLGKAFRENVITAEQHARAIADLRSEFEPAVEVQQTWLGKLTPTIDVVNLATRAYGQMASAVRGVVNTVKDQLEDIDKLIASSDKLGISAESFQNIATAAKFADVEVSAASNAVEKMLVAISKGEDGAKKFADTFRMLGLDAEQLQSMRPDQALGKILDALRGIGNQADKVRIATQIFGNADVLRMTSQGIAEAADRLEEFGGHLKDLDVEKFKQLDDAMEDLSTDVDSLTKRFALELTPAISTTAAVLDAMLTNVKQGSPLIEGIGTGAGATGIPFGRVTGLVGGIGRVGGEATAARMRAAELDKQIEEQRQREAISMTSDPELHPNFKGKMPGEVDTMYEDQKRQEKEELENEKVLARWEQYRDQERIAALKEQQRIKEAINRADVTNLDVIRQGSREALMLQSRSMMGGGERVRVEEVTYQ